MSVVCAVSEWLLGGAHTKDGQLGFEYVPGVHQRKIVRVFGGMSSAMSKTFGFVSLKAGVARGVTEVVMASACLVSVSTHWVDCYSITLIKSNITI